MTQEERIIDHIRKKGSITAKEAMEEYGIMRLASRISDLKKHGFGITRDTVAGKNRYGETTYFARYREVKHEA